MNIKNSIVMGIAGAIMLTTLSGCKAKVDPNEDPFYQGKTREEIMTLCDQYITKCDTLQSQYDELYTLYNGVQGETKPSAAISTVEDGTLRLTFNSVDDKIVFPVELKYPDATEIPSNGSVNIVSRANISPGTNWVMKFGPSSIELEHPSGITGVVKVGTQNLAYNPEDIQEKALKPFFEKVPQANIVYTTINANNRGMGIQGKTPTLIDGKDAFMRVGMVAYDRYCLTYCFIYEGTQDVSKDESITLLLNTLDLAGGKILVEQ